jgi:hypothetical protein
MNNDPDVQLHELVLLFDALQYARNSPESPVKHVLVQLATEKCLAHSLFGQLTLGLRLFGTHGQDNVCQAVDLVRRVKDVDRLRNFTEALGLPLPSPAPTVAEGPPAHPVSSSSAVPVAKAAYQRPPSPPKHSQTTDVACSEAEKKKQKRPRRSSRKKQKTISAHRVDERRAAAVNTDSDESPSEDTPELREEDASSIVPIVPDDAPLLFSTWRSARKKRGIGSVEGEDEEEEEEEESSSSNNPINTEEEDEDYHEGQEEEEEEEEEKQ